MSAPITNPMNSRPSTFRAVRAMQGAMHALFVVLVLIGLIRALWAGEHSAARIVCIATATTAFGAIYLSGLWLERHARTSAAPPHRVSSQLWIVALVAGWVALMCLAQDFAWVAFGLYFLILHVAHRALAVTLIGVVLLGSVVALNVEEPVQAGSVIGPVMGMLVALGISWIYVQLRRESDARAELISQLVAAQDDVLATQEALAQTQHEAGMMAERERLARDIHDTLAQSFSSILLLSRAELAGSPGNQVLQQIDATASEGLAQAREVVHALAPAELVSTPLASALQRLAHKLEEQSNISVRCEVDGLTRALPAAIEVELLRIAQGALANVRLHAQAARAAITLTYQSNGVDLEIIDDGVGFTDSDVARAPLSGSGFGLRAIRERVAALGGTLTIETAPGEGTALVVHIPVSGARA